MARLEEERSSFGSISSVRSLDNGVERTDTDDQYELKWAAVQRLPTFERITSALFDEEEGRKNSRVMDVRKLGAQEKRVFIDRLIKHIENDNLRLLQKLRHRIDKVGIQLPTVEVRYENLSIEVDCEVVHGKPLPTLWNSQKSIFSALIPFSGSKQEARISIIKDVSGIIKPGRMTLLLGPPGCGKTTFLLALSGKLSHSLKLTGEISYNGYRLDEFVPQKTSAYISQYDLHIPEMTVRETLDFSARCQGSGSRTEIITEVSKREKEAGIVPDPDLDTYMKAISVEATETESSLQTDYILKILGLDICADTLVGDPMRRGISGGQKKRLTTGEMIVGPTKALFMDEISNGLDSSTTFQIISCLQHLVHITDATALISLLQPAPETFDLFDDVILMAEGKIVYHGPRTHVLEFFEDCGFKCPERKGTADFLQEVISRKDQEQYWSRPGHAYSYMSADRFVGKFREFHVGKKLHEELLNPFDKSKSHKNALSFKTYSLTKWKLFKACIMREFLLMKRNYFVYVFKTAHLFIIASITMTVFLRTRLELDVIHANYLMGSLFYALILLLVDGIPELAMTVSRISVFFKQKELFLYPAWAYAIPAALLKVPLSLLEAFVWTVLTYYVIGYSPELGRFFRHFLILFLVHLNSMSLFRCVASIFQTSVASLTASSVCLLFLCLFGGFIIPKPSLPAWVDWGFWLSPLTFGEIGLTLNEFLAPRWQKRISANVTIGAQVLESRGLNFDGYFYWISVAALIAITILFNIIFILALTFLKPPGRSRAIISAEKYSKLKLKEVNGTSVELIEKPIAHPPKVPGRGRMVLPFEPLTVSFQNVQYYVDTPIEIKKRGFTEKKLQLLSNITGVFKPRVLTALMGVSGAGKTTLMDVLSGRKTGGYVEGEIRIGGYLKAQDTFARISGYCEQTDIHSPNITVEESLLYSAWLRLPSSIDRKTRAEFVNEVLETIELNDIKDSLVGMVGASGLSTEQRKRLTIAVELVANPSVIFMDEPTTSLDARAAAIVMRVVKNVVETGRTIVCTIHQPSIDIFESFDELILMKSGGQLIYSGPLGQHSSLVIEYFEKIQGLPHIKNNYNPATWMLEVTSPSAEADLGVDFAQIYKTSALFEENKKMVEHYGSPRPGSKELHFPSRFARNGWEQLKACVWKHNLSYWRSPSYNLTRMFYLIATSMLFGTLFWKKGTKITTQQDLFTIFGGMYIGVIFIGINNCSTTLPIIATERIVLYRERFAGMYSPWANSMAQVLVETPYLFIGAVLHVIITYPMLGYHLSGLKIFWSFYAMFCNLLCYNYLGMLLVSMTPNVQVASILASLFYTMMNLFSGFIIPKSRIPTWWLWLYYMMPTSWVLNGLLTSQYGDIDTEILAFGKRKTISAFIEDYFGYRHDFLGVVAIVLLIYPIVVACLFAHFIGKLNFQRR